MDDPEVLKALLVVLADLEWWESTVSIADGGTERALWLLASAPARACFVRSVGWICEPAAWTQLSEIMRSRFEGRLALAAGEYLQRMEAAGQGDAGCDDVAEAFANFCRRGPFPAEAACESLIECLPTLLAAPAKHARAMESARAEAARLLEIFDSDAFRARIGSPRL